MALVVVTDHPFDDLDLERELLTAAGHHLRFEGNVTSPEDIVALAAEADAVGFKVARRRTRTSRTRR